MRTTLATVGVLVLSLFADLPAYATFCTGWPTPCQAYEEADAIFIGTVVAVERVDAARAAALAPPFAMNDRMASTTVFPVQWVVRLRVEQAIKGMREREVEIASDYADAYKAGQRLLIYAARDPGTGGLSPIGCGRTGRLEHAADDLLYLKQISSVGRSSRLAGTAARFDTIPGDDDAALEALPGVRITLTDRKGTLRELHTSKDGVYEWLGLPPGLYLIHADVPAHLSLVEWTTNDRVVEVTAGTCTTADFTTRSTGSIAGRVADPLGRGVANVIVSVIRAERTDVLGSVLARRAFGITNGMGDYSIGGLPPGRYLVGVNLESGPRPESPYPRTFHPRGPLDVAAMVRLGEAERAERINIALPARLRVRTIIGTVTDAGRRPIAGAYVWLDDDDDPGSESMVTSSARTDALGGFAMRVMESAKGWLQATTGDESGSRVRYATPLVVDFRANRHDFDLVVPAR